MNLKHIILMLAAGLFAACSQDELTEGKGSTLPAGQYPLTFTADGIGIEVTTRSTVDNNWQGVQSVSVQVGSDVRTYTVTPSDDYSTATLTSDNPFYWNSATETKNIAAWHPINTDLPTIWNVSSDQSNDGITASDFIYAHKSISFGDESKSLTFYHQTAKVVINILNESLNTADGVNPIEINNIATGGTFTPPSDANDYYGTWNVTEESSSITGLHAITPNTVNGQAAKHSYTALVIPQAIAADTRLLKLNVNGYDSPFYYTVPAGGIEWKTGNEYTYNITITPTGLQVTTSSSINWTGEDASGTVTTYSNYNDAGAGTSDDPYRIYNAVQFASMGGQNLESICFRLMADIDMTDYNFTPICNNGTNAYNGTFDGNGHVIKGLNITGTTNGGLFHSVYNGTVKNLILSDCNISSTQEMSGGISGTLNGGTIENCHVTGSIKGNVFAGGLVGYVNSGSIIACSSNLVNISAQNAGGIVGGARGNIVGCCNIGTSNSGNGILGLNNGGAAIITECYFTTGVDNGYGTYISNWTQNVINNMNNAISTAGYTYQWVLGENGLPMIKQ